MSQSKVWVCLVDGNGVQLDEFSKVPVFPGDDVDDIANRVAVQRPRLVGGATASELRVFGPYSDRPSEEQFVHLVTATHSLVRETRLAGVEGKWFLIRVPAAQAQRTLAAAGTSSRPVACVCTA